MVEKDGYLAVNDGPQHIMDLGWDLVCLPGSFIWERNPPEEKTDGIADYEKHEVSETRVWRNPLREWDYLDGVKDLFLEDEIISVHANGGRHQRRQGERQEVKLDRELRAFGPCAAVERERILAHLDTELILLLRLYESQCPRPTEGKWGFHSCFDE